MALNLNHCHSGSTLFWTGEISVSSSVKTDTKQRKQPHINDLIMKMNLIVGQQYDRLFITL